MLSRGMRNLLLKSFLRQRLVATRLSGQHTNVQADNGEEGVDGEGGISMVYEMGDFSTCA